MFNARHMFAFVSLLLAVPLHAQEPLTAGVAGSAGPPAQNPNAPFLNFDGIVIQIDPLEVKSVNGEVRTFLPPRKDAPAEIQAIWPNAGDLVSLTYEPSSKGNILKEEIKITGATIIGTIKEIATDMSVLIVRTRNLEKPENEVNVPLRAGTQFQPLVSAMRPGDGIKATYARDGDMNAAEGVNSLRSLEWQSKQVGRAERWWSLIGAMIMLFILAYVFTRGHPTELYLGEDNRYSSSKFQTVLWFGLVVSAYIAIVSHRILAAGWSYVGGVDIPPNLLILSGISVLTFTAAKAITLGKVENAAAAGKPEIKAAADAPKATDLITDDSNRTDLGDFQMVAITILAVIIYAISAVEFMEEIEFRRVVTMPDVDATLLSIFGLGQAAYLGKKAAGGQ
ncbi:MAG: hypothetical protein ACREUR_06525 [Nitrosospira sp.]